MSTKIGLLPYNTDDDSVVFRCPMTSLASITDIGGSDLSSGNNLFDAVKGMNMQRNGSDISGILFKLSTMTLESGSHDNLPQGQISFDIERAALTIPSSVSGSQSNGYENTENKMLIGWVPNGTGAGQAGYLYKRTAANDYDMYRKVGAGGTIGQISRLASNKYSDEWARITISWQSRKMDIYIDGFLINSASRATNNHATQFGDIYLGSFINATTVPNWDTGHYIRNFLMASKPVALSYHPYLAHIMMVGDSFAGGQYQNHLATTGHLNENNVIADYLNAQGHGFNTFTVYSNGGGTVLDAGVDPLQDDVNAAGKTRAQAAAEKPTFILFQGGVNDSSSSLTNFLTDLKDHIKEYMCDGTTYTVNTSGRRMILVAQCSGTNGVGSTIPSGVKDVRELIVTIPAWWDAAYPNRAGHVKVVDMFNYMTSDEDNINTDLYDSLFVHPNSLGDSLTGKYIAQQMLRML